MQSMKNDLQTCNLTNLQKILRKKQTKKNRFLKVPKKKKNQTNRYLQKKKNLATELQKVNGNISSQEVKCKCNKIFETY